MPIVNVITSKNTVKLDLPEKVYFDDIITVEYAAARKSTTPPKRKRGRPKGSKNKVKSIKKTKKLTTKSFTKKVKKAKISTEVKPTKQNSIPEDFIASNAHTKVKRTKKVKERLEVDKTYKFNGVIETLKFQFSKEGYPYLQFEQFNVMPFNVSFDITRAYTHLYINFTHSSLKREFTTAGITTTLGNAFQIPSNYTPHLSKKEKMFLYFLRKWCSENEKLTTKQLEEMELEWNKPKEIEIIDIGKE